MAFEIRYRNGEVIPSHVLNEEASKLWGVEIDGDFVYPNFAKTDKRDDPKTYHWANVIGPSIQDESIRLQPTWVTVKEIMFTNRMVDYWDESFPELKYAADDILDYLRPYLELIDLWRELGHVPIKIKD